jgi:hypothetical protein
MGRFGSNEGDDEGDRPIPRHRREPYSRPRVRIRESNPDETIPQRKPRRNEHDPAGTKTHYEDESDALTMIKRIVLDHDMMPVAQIVTIVTDAGHSVSPVTVSNIRKEFRHTLKLLATLGLLRQKKSS